jgi:hypothetical protein
MAAMLRNLEHFLELAMTSPDDPDDLEGDVLA